MGLVRVPRSERTGEGTMKCAECKRRKARIKVDRHYGLCLQCYRKVALVRLAAYRHKRTALTDKYETVKRRNITHR